MASTKNNLKVLFEDNHLIVINKQSIWIPISIFTNRKLGVLETLTKHLKEEGRLANYEIADILNRDNRTIWTAYDRAKKKNET